MVPKNHSKIKAFLILWLLSVNLVAAVNEHDETLGPQVLRQLIPMGPGIFTAELATGRVGSAQPLLSQTAKQYLHLIPIETRETIAMRLGKHLIDLCLAGHLPNPHGTFEAIFALSAYLIIAPADDRPGECGFRAIPPLGIDTLDHMCLVGAVQNLHEHGFSVPNVALHVVQEAQVPHVRFFMGLRLMDPGFVFTHEVLVGAQNMGGPLLTESVKRLLDAEDTERRTHWSISLGQQLARLCVYGRLVHSTAIIAFIKNLDAFLVNIASTGTPEAPAELPIDELDELALAGAMDILDRLETHNPATIV